jgi:hypothetical protein
MLDSLSNRRIQQRTIIQIHCAEIQHLYFLEDTIKKPISLIGLLMTLAIPSGLFAQQAGYSQTNLVFNTAGVANTTDQGKKDTGLGVTIPGATHNLNGNCSPGCSTSNVSDGNGAYFNGGQFIFDTEDGLIASWTGTSNTAAVTFDNSASGAVYKGLASINNTFLLAANSIVEKSTFSIGILTLHH